MAAVVLSLSPPSLSSSPPSPSSSSSGFPVLAVAVLGISATAFLLVSYYIFITKCCFRWQQIDPLSRIFSIHRSNAFSPPSPPQVNDDPTMPPYSPSSWQSRGLNDLLIRDIPTLHYTRLLHPQHNSSSSSARTCCVCLNDFQENDLLRVLPKCSHAFHLDCIDVWLVTHSNCPLCRSTISGRNRYRLVDTIVAPNSSPQDPQPMLAPPGSIVMTDQDDFVVIEIGRDGDGDGGNTTPERGGSSRFLVQQPRSYSSRKIIGKSRSRKFHHVSIMGDEGIHVSEKDDQFCIQPMRRSFSMDSAADPGVYLSVQEILRQNGLSSHQDRNSEESSSAGSRSKRSIFSFGQGRGSSSAVLPI